MRFILFIFLIITFAGPFYILLTGGIDLKADYRTANRESAKIAPDPMTHREAIIQVYAARTFSWRGIFAVHTWIAIKNKDAKDYIVYQAVGWRLYHKLSLITDSPDTPDRYWFGEAPTLLLDIRGDAATKLIPHVQQAVHDYPYAKTYHYWPGPNSNTFIAYIARQVPSLQLALTSNAIGKDYLSTTQFFAHAPSDTGYQFSLFGLLGVTVAKKEGLEINILGLIYGFSPAMRTIKLPGFGDIQF